jgi:membrane-bound lytic murein transglycosylase D
MNFFMRAAQSARLLCFGLGVLGLAYPVLVHSETLPLTRFEKFGVKLDPWSEDQIEFWVKVFTKYDTSDSLIHDSMNLRHVYRVVESSSPKKIQAAKNEVRDELKSIYEKNIKAKAVTVQNLTPAERELFEIHDGNLDPRAYLFASDPERIRNQIGEKDRLQNAYAISRLYLPRMEEMFVEEGVPKELTRLPFVESGFVNQAKSSVGALGIWQFMPKTAQKDLRLDAAIDERYDPLKSTRAAAKFLKQNERILKNWGLAVMAYHHGAGLVSQAVKRLKTHDPVVIIREFKNGNFQFASKNYLFEFLAMLDVDSMHASFFSESLPLKKLPAYITVSFPVKHTMKEIVDHFQLKESELKILNPHFKAPIWSNQLPIPSHYPVRLSGIDLEQFRAHPF